MENSFIYFQLTQLHSKLELALNFCYVTLDLIGLDHVARLKLVE